MISREKLAAFSGNAVAATAGTASGSIRFDIEGYLAQHRFDVISRKPWQSRPGGLIYELDECPFNSDHRDGSAAFTLVNGVVGFACQHNGCNGKTIRDVFAKYPPQPSTGENEQTQAQALIAMCENVELFHTPQGEAYARVPIGQHRENWSLRSKGFSRWLLREFHRAAGKPPGAKGLQDAINLLEAKAQFESPEEAVWVRLAEYGGKVYVDLCNDAWEAVEIDPDGWRIVADPPVRFRRPRGMRPMARPEAGGTATLLRRFINIGDDHNWILCLAWLAAALRFRGPFPILILLGGQGSAKTSLEKILRRLTDPSVAPVRTPPKSDRDLLIAAVNSWVIAFDNLSCIPGWLSDGLCRITTGGGLSIRELYSDSEEVFFDAARPVILNGIDHLAERPDLAERALVLNLPRIKKEDRKDEQRLFADFENQLPRIQGTLFTAVSWALRRLPTIQLASKPRMADFALWATAAAPALGYTEEAFVAAYQANQAETVRDTLESDVVAAAITTLMEEIPATDSTAVWIGTCKDLLVRLDPLTTEGVRRSRAWPKTPKALSGQLRRLIIFLAEGGIEIHFHPRGAKGIRPLTISRSSPESTATTVTSMDVTRLSPIDTARKLGGGAGPGVLDQSSVSCPPSPSNSLRLHELGGQVTEVAVQTTIEPQEPAGKPPSSHPRLERIEL